MESRMSNQPQLSDEQVVKVLRSLRSLWIDVLSIDESDFPSDPNESMHDYFNRTIADDSLALLSMTFELERMSGKRVTPKQIVMWLNPPQIQSLTDDGLTKCIFANQLDLTETRGLRGLAEWVWRNCPKIRVEPYRIGSHESLPAGVYIVLEQIAHRVAPRTPKFGPSSKVRVVFPRRVYAKCITQIAYNTGLSKDCVKADMGTEFGDDSVPVSITIASLAYIAVAMRLLAMENPLALYMAFGLLFCLLMLLGKFQSTPSRIWSRSPERTLADVSRAIACRIEDSAKEPDLV